MAVSSALSGRDYLAAHGVQEALAAAVSEVLRTRPAKPIMGICDILSKCAGEKVKQTTSAVVPIVDISPFVDEAAHDDEARRQVAEQCDSAMMHVGFAIITGHGVPPHTISALRDGAMGFFADDLASKNVYNYGPYGNPFGGFTGMGTEAVSRTRDKHGSDGGADHAGALPDLVESFIFKPESPKPKPAVLEEAGAAYYAALLRVLETLHKLTAASLGLPADFFEPFYSPAGHYSLRLAYYPPLSPEAPPLVPPLVPPPEPPPTTAPSELPPPPHPRTVSSKVRRISMTVRRVNHVMSEEAAQRIRQEALVPW
jgi:hypothetical protein